MGKRRAVRMDRFKNQLAENVLGPDGLIELEVADGEKVSIRLPLLLNEGDDYAERIEAASQNGGEAIALVLLGGHPDRSAEEQWDTWTGAGYTADDLAIAYHVEMADARERLGKFRYSG